MSQAHVSGDLLLAGLHCNSKALPLWQRLSLWCIGVLAVSESEPRLKCGTRLFSQDGSMQGGPEAGCLPVLQQGCGWAERVRNTSQGAWLPLNQMRRGFGRAGQHA